MQISEGEYLAHYGTLHRSGRYPWGSGGNTPGLPRHASLPDYVKDMRRQGLTDSQIAEGLGMKTTEFRARMSVAKNEQRAANIAMAQRLRDKGYSPTEIGRRMNAPESSVRSWLQPGQMDKVDVLTSTATMLREQVHQKTYVDVGSGTEHYVGPGISQVKLNTAISILKDEGYVTHTINVPQLGTTHDTRVKVLCPPGTTYGQLFKDRDKIQQIAAYTDDGGHDWTKPLPPKSISSSRVAIKYKEDGGAKEDGMIYVRPGVPDVSLGNSRYSQVRIKVDDKHYLKGMAMYRDDLPPGADLQFCTNKSFTGDKHDVMKKLEDDPDLPFGAVIKHQHVEHLPDGTKRLTSVMNVVNDQGDWANWSRTLSAQMLSKQRPSLAKSQLDMRYEDKVREFEQLKQLTNPTVRRYLLEKFGDSVDTSAVHMEAKHMPGQAYHAILPLTKIKEGEIYAPNYNTGDQVALVRFPHGGTFEIPELTVNNNNRDGKKYIGSDAPDAVGIHYKVAERLSGADFDGDTVLVIPNNHGKIKSTKALEGLKDFDPVSAYPKYEGMQVMTKAQKGKEMGQITNLITDMTIHNASRTELAAAIRHSMVVIDAQKKELNYRQSAKDNGIAKLKEKYQGGKNKGASTLISRATAQERVPKRKPRSAAKGGPIDKATGRREYELTGRPGTQMSTKLAETTDARTLMSGTNGTPIERIYADHSNRMKTLANLARKESVNTPRAKYSSTAAKTYKQEVASLNVQLKLSERNRPLERQAQIIGNAIVRAKREADPNMDAETLKKVKYQALNEARIRTGAKRNEIKISKAEWEAIQAGAISDTKVAAILTRADMDQVREYATPKNRRLMSDVKTERAKAMLDSGYTRAEVARQLGVSLTTLDVAIQ